jgi:hypothetical protein
VAAGGAVTDQIIGLVASRHALPRWIAPCVSAGLARAIHHGADTKQHGDRHEDNKDNGMLHVAASLLRAPTPPDVCGFSAVQAECAVNRQWNRKGNMNFALLERRVRRRRVGQKKGTGRIEQTAVGCR